MPTIAKINGIAIANIAKINGIEKANIAKIDGLGAEEPPTGEFRFEVVTAGADTFQLPIYDGGTYDFNVDWGDSSSDDITAFDDAAANHSYAGADTYNVVITGTLVGWRFNNAGDKDLIHDISEWGVLDVGNLYSYFYGCSNLTISATDSMNCPDTTNFRYSFYGCTSLTAIPSGLFDECTLVAHFGHCFHSCTSLTAIPSGLFDNCTLVANFEQCFRDCTSLTAIPSGLFDECTLVTDFWGCFCDCSGINTDLPINLILYNVEMDDCGNMFCGCSNMTGDGTAFVDKAEDHGVTLHAECFLNCTSLPDYNLIPADWGGGGA